MKIILKDVEKLIKIRNGVIFRIVVVYSESAANIDCGDCKIGGILLAGYLFSRKVCGKVSCQLSATRYGNETL